MTIIRNMHPGELAQRMGTAALADAVAMSELLLDAGFEKIEEVPADVWATMLEKVAIRAEWADRPDVAAAALETKPGKLTRLEAGEYVTSTGWLIYRTVVEKSARGWIVARPTNWFAARCDKLADARARFA